MRSTPLEDSPEAAPGLYSTRAYNTKERACSFWHQVDEIFEIGASTVLEVGSGSGLVTNWLRTAGFEVKTLDLDPELEPDMVGSVTDIPLSANSCDAVLCCQVLEHLPFDQLPMALTEIGRVSRMGAVVSLPDVTPWVGMAYPLYFGLYADQVRKRLPGGAGRGLLAVLRRQIRLRDYLFARFVPVDWAYGGKVSGDEAASDPRAVPFRLTTSKGGSSTVTRSGSRDIRSSVCWRPSQPPSSR